MAEGRHLLNKWEPLEGPDGNIPAFPNIASISPDPSSRSDRRPRAEGLYVILDYVKVGAADPEEGAGQGKVR